MNWLINNWYLIIAAVAVISFIVYKVIKFIKEPKENQIKSLKEWLKYAITVSEKELGAKTGQLKLRMVFDMAIQKFPWLLKFISFDTFSDWVDEALKWLAKQSESNKAIQNYISG